MASSSTAQSNVAPDAAVITIDGFCAQNALATVVKDAAAGCKTVVTRAQFERLVDALDPNMKPPFRSALADALPRMMLFSQKAKEMGLDKDPRYPQMMKWGSLQMLAGILSAQMQKKAADISDADIEKYYKDNTTKFQQAELQRIFVPNSKQASGFGTEDSSGNQNSASEGAAKAEAEKLWAKAVAGGDFTALQHEAYAAAGLNSPPPEVNLGKRTVSSLPPGQQRVFDLQPGQVSEVLSDAEGFYLYKVVSKQMMPLVTVQKQIRDTLQLERTQASADALFGSVRTKLNKTYFGSTTTLEESPLLDPTKTAPADKPDSAPASQTAQSGSLDKEWADSSVRSDLLVKSDDTFVAPPESVVPQSAPVITLEGLCDDKAASAPDCQTIVTRGDFEAMQKAIDPKATGNELNRMAEQYADLLMRGEKARQLDLENTEQYKVAMTFMATDSRFKMLGNLILDRSRQLSDADVAEFYHQNPRLFEEIKTQRLVIPQYKAFPPGKGKPTPEEIAASHVEMKKEAESIAARAALPGADFQALEDEAWKFSGYVEESPEVKQPSLLRWEVFPLTRLPIFDLKVGEVSKLIDEPKNGFYVYKVVAKREVPLEEGRAYIRKRYAGVRYDDAVSRLISTIKFSLDNHYFGQETQPPAPGNPGQQPGTQKTKGPSLDIKIPNKVNL